MCFIVRTTVEGVLALLERKGFVFSESVEQDTLQKLGEQLIPVTLTDQTLIDKTALWSAGQSYLSLPTLWKYLPGSAQEMSREPIKWYLFHALDELLDFVFEI